MGMQLPALGPGYFTLMAVMTIIGALSMLIYMIYIKKYFDQPPTNDSQI